MGINRAYKERECVWEELVSPYLIRAPSRKSIGLHWKKADFNGKPLKFKRRDSRMRILNKIN